MKRKLFALLLSICLLISLPVNIFALDPMARFVDNANLVSDPSKANALEDKITNILYAYDMDVVILTVDSLDGKSSSAYADDYYDNNGYGVDSKHSGLLLLVALNDREWAISTCGKAIRAVTDDEADEIFSKISDKISSGKYYEAFITFLTEVENEYKAYAEEITMDIEDILIRLGVALLVGAVIALIVLLIMRSKMNTAKAQRGAGSYIRNETYDLFRCHDIFLYSRTTKTRKSDNNSGGGSHRSSSGRSHGGGSGRF